LEETSPDLRYPVGEFHAKLALTSAEREIAVQEIASAANRLSEAVAGLPPAQLDTPYREGGWTVRQVFHHLADSHQRWVMLLNHPELGIISPDYALALSGWHCVHHVAQQ
jgi:hypothetical protein